MGRKFSIVIGVCLLAAGVCYFLIPNLREWKIQREVNAIMQDFGSNRDNVSDFSNEQGFVEDVTQTIMPELYQALSAYNTDLVQTGQQILDAWSYEQSPIDIDSLNGGSPLIGYIEIPDMKNLRLPLYLGASPEHLAKGAAVLSQTSMPIGGVDTNCVISGHRGYNGSAFFQHIDRLQVGSMVYVTNPWETLKYQVVSMQVVQPTNVDSVFIQDGKDMLTLVSCHPYVIGGGPERYLVFCERVLSDTNDYDSKNVQEQVLSGNDTQRLETMLRIMAPMFVVLVMCFFLVIRLKITRKHK